MTPAVFVTFLIKTLEVVSTRTNSRIDDEALALLKAIAASPPMMEWLATWLDGQADLPEGAAALQKLPPNVEAMVSRDKLAELIAILRMLADLYRQFKPLLKK